MTFPLGGIVPIGTGGVAGIDSTSIVPASQAASATGGADFAGAVGQSLTGLERLDRTSADKATKAATGDLTDIHDYVISATQAQVATELTTTVRNKALEAFNDIMRMPL